MMDSAKKMLRKDKRRFYTDLKYQKRKKKMGHRQYLRQRLNKFHD